MYKKTYKPKKQLFENGLRNYEDKSKLSLDKSSLYLHSVDASSINFSRLDSTGRKSQYSRNQTNENISPIKPSGKKGILKAAIGRDRNQDAGKSSLKMRDLARGKSSLKSNKKLGIAFGGKISLDKQNMMKTSV